MARPPERRLERIGHRGIPAERLENTLPSFVLAIELGADSVELDTHVSSDGSSSSTMTRRFTASRSRAILVRPGIRRSWRRREFPRSIRYSSRSPAEPRSRRDEGSERRGARGSRGAPACYTPVALHSFDHAAVERARVVAPDIPRGVLLDRAISIRSDDAAPSSGRLPVTSGRTGASRSSDLVRAATDWAHE